MNNQGRTILDRLNELPGALREMAVLDCDHPARICDRISVAVVSIATSEGSIMGEGFWKGVAYRIAEMEEDEKLRRLASPKFLEGYNAALHAYGMTSAEPTALVPVAELQLLRLKAQAFDLIHGIVDNSKV